jgi:hypothetical protein
MMQEARMSEQVRLLLDALRARPPEDEEAEGDLEVEKMGDTAFDWLAQEVRCGHLKPAETVRGLRLLSRLTRQFCVRRKGELLDIVLALAIDPDTDQEVRSVAANIAVWSVSSAKRLANPVAAFGRLPRAVQNEAVPVVQRALELGLTPDMETFAKEFLMHVHNEK